MPHTKPATSELVLIQTKILLTGVGIKTMLYSEIEFRTEKIVVRVSELLIRDIGFLSLDIHFARDLGMLILLSILVLMAICRG